MVLSVLAYTYLDRFHVTVSANDPVTDDPHLERYAVASVPVPHDIATVDDYVALLVEGLFELARGLERSNRATHVSHGESAAPPRE